MKEAVVSPLNQNSNEPNISESASATVEGVKAETRQIQYNFPEIEALKTGVLAVTEKVKENIDSDKYTLLLSDEVGGRIPTLIFRKMIKDRHPESKVRTNFIASGQSYLPTREETHDYKKLFDHLQQIAKPEDKILLITQYVHHGGTLRTLLEALHHAGMYSIDIAAVHSSLDEETLSGELSGHTVYVGNQSSSILELEDKAKVFSGVAKLHRMDYEPIVKTIEEVIEREGRERIITQEEWRDFFGIEKGEEYWQFKSRVEDPEKVAEFAKMKKAPLSQEERVEMKQRVIKAREDISTLAHEVEDQVWHKA